MDLEKIGVNARNWVDSTQDIETPGSINYGIRLHIGSVIKLLELPVTKCQILSNVVMGNYLLGCELFAISNAY